MSSQGNIPGSATSLEQILGYLNFSSGTDDPLFFRAIDKSFEEAVQSRTNECGQRPIWQDVLTTLQHALNSASDSNPAFKVSNQAQDVLEFAASDFLPKYKDYHSILLHYLDPDELFNQFFVGRVFQAVLKCYVESEGKLDFHTVRRRLDDYIGYRPVATLESQKIEPYDHEWTRPIPIYLAEVGSAYGTYQPFVDYAIEMIRSAPNEILRSAQFDIDALDEMAIDPRAYDFEHPVNKRPNYHFGQWDPHHLDLSGYYRRFVVQKVTLDALAKRCDVDELLRPEMVYEAGAVLAGTILMATSICGRSPDAFDSNTSIASLLPGIARMRDQFYQWLLSTIKGKHGDRLRIEAKEKRQPFGGARQHLNAELARLRETQLENVRLAGIYARMGYSENAREQAMLVPVASARIKTQIGCGLTEAEKSIQNNSYKEATEQLRGVFQLIEEGIECGALIDPWNIIGFDGQFSLFPAMENSVQDDRALFLVDTMNHLFATYSVLWSHAATRDETDLSKQIRNDFDDVTDWWHRFAAHEVSNLDSPDGKEIFKAAEQVANAMNLWHKSGSETGKVSFWADHADLFSRPRAYDLIANALLEKEDLSTSMALLMHWLMNAERVGLESPSSSFHSIVEQWLFRTCQKALDDFQVGQVDQCEQTLSLVCKFMDHMEPNADHYWEVPEFSLANGKSQSKEELAGEVIDEEVDPTVQAAYENIVYIDSTDDGIDGQLFEQNEGQADYLEEEAQRLEGLLRFHETLARVWQMASPLFAKCSVRRGETQPGKSAGDQAAQSIKKWAGEAERRIGKLHELLSSVESFQPSIGIGDAESVIEFDRQRITQEGLLERIIQVIVETRHALRMLNAAGIAMTGKPANSEVGNSEVLMADVFAAVMKNDRQLLLDQINLLYQHLKTQPLLYVPISRNGAPSKIELVKSRQLFIRKLLEILPRFGLVEQTFRLLNVARSMERSHPVGNGAVTEFDDLFEIGFRGVVNCLIHSANHDDSTADQRQLLFRWLERFTESSLIIWLKHSRTLRLSVLEKVHEKKAWKRLVYFIKEYGDEIFTQKFLNFGHVRGILNQGVEHWLEQKVEAGEECKLFNDFGNRLSRSEAVSHLSLILEAMLENHLEYQDYNSTTTQSDQGDMLYMLIDFLRLKVGYDRICWHLRPVFWAHENLVNAGKEKVAKRWRRSLVDRIERKANRFVRHLEKLQRRYAMQMPSVANRIKERFIKPMHIDRMKALVQPAIEHDNPKAATYLEMLQHDANQLIKKPEGSGIKVPSWLSAIEDELAEALDHSVSEQKILDLFVQSHCLAREDAREQLNKIADMTNRKKHRGT